MSPAQRLTADDPEDDAQQPEAGEPEARQVQPPVGAEGLGQAGARERDQDQADGDVETEDPVPRDALHDGAADQRAERDAEAADAGPDAEREPAALRREGLGQQGQRERQDERGAQPLHGARGHQRVDARRERGGEAGRGEHADADHEHPPAAEAVAERGAGQQQHGEAERVGVDRPLQRLDRRAEVGADGRQGRRHDEVVERRHEQGDGHERQGPSGAGLG
jgi:hypothetical protein